MSAFIQASTAGIISRTAGAVTDTGWVSAGTVQTVQDGSSFRPWANPANAQISNNAYANQGPLDAPSNDYLQASNFDFSVIPGTAAILGVEVRIERIGQEFVGASRIYDAIIQLLVGGTRQGDDKSLGAGWAWAAEELKIFGADNDLWGVSLTSTNVKSSDFGWTIRCLSSPTNGAANVDHMEMRITYQE